MTPIEGIFSDQSLETMPVQVLALVSVLVLAWIIRWRAEPFFNRASAQAADSGLGRDLPLVPEIVRVFRGGALPALSWFMVWVGSRILDRVGLPNALLLRVLPLLAAWLAYRVLAGMIRLVLADKQADAWHRFVLRPLMVLFAGLFLLGVTDQVLGHELNWYETKITLGALLAGVGILAATLVLSRGARHYLGDVLLPRAGIEPALTQALSALTAYGITVLGFVLALDVVGIDLTALTFVAGGLSVGIGIGLQDIFRNFLSGFILLFERSMGPGDIVKVGDSLGRVHSVGIRSTRIDTIDNVEIIVPNSSFLSDVVTNFTRDDTRVRASVTVGTSYDSDPEEVTEALLKAADHPDVLSEPAPEVEFIDFGESSIDFSLEAWTDNPFEIEQFKSGLRYRIWKELKTRNIEIPFPQRDIHIRGGGSSPLVG